MVGKVLIYKMLEKRTNSIEMNDKLEWQFRFSK